MTDLCKICCITLILVSAFLHIKYFRCTKLKASCPHSCEEKKENISTYRHRNRTQEKTNLFSLIQYLFSFLIQIENFGAVEVRLEGEINGIYELNTSLFYLLGSNKWLGQGLCWKLEMAHQSACQLSESIG